MTYAETRAALASARRLDRISAEQFTDAKRRFELLWSRVHVINPDQALVDAAGEMSERHALRGYDAIHLASAVQVNRDSVHFLLTTWDADLAEAAFAERISTVRE